ncbi:hypothetical protein [Sphingomonas sp.]|uniref:hypothetical protein n=1 Tax=Sphingomonas sp. TaxID=28214 RepID=UPI00286D1A9E|nr:hypothetical protein [Sphingomonas sp.]
MIRLIIFNTLLVGACGYALWRGRSDERLAAIACIIATAASIALVAPAGLRYASVELGVLIVDVFTLGAFTFVALRSDRFWPLWISGLQLTTSTAHFLKALDPDMVPIAYAAAGRLWSYPILLILAVGTWRSRRRLHFQPIDASAYRP